MSLICFLDKSLEYVKGVFELVLLGPLCLKEHLDEVIEPQILFFALVVQDVFEYDLFWVSNFVFDASHIIVSRADRT